MEREAQRGTRRVGKTSFFSAVAVQHAPLACCRNAPDGFLEESDRSLWIADL